jgi:hypothetical protein
MTHAAALNEIRNAVEAPRVFQRQFGTALPKLAVVTYEALATLVDGDWIVRPLGVVEAEAKRERAGNGDSGLAAAEGGAVSESTKPPSPLPANGECAECGAPLTYGEAAREWARETKYEGMCTECCLLKAGLV